MDEEKQPLSPAPEPDAATPPPDKGRHRKASRTMTPGQQKRRQKSVFQYIAVLFATAFVLLLFTFMMERRQYEQLQAENQEQIDNLQQSVSAVQSLQALYDQNDTLKEQVAQLQSELESLKTLLAESREESGELSQQLTAAGRALDALDWFWQVDEAYVRGKYAQCRSLIREMEAANLVDALPRESVTDNGRYSPYDRYQEIYDRLF